MDATVNEIILKFRDYLFDEKGEANTSLSRIADKIGIPVESIRQYFSNEEELIEKVLEFERRNFEVIFQDHDFEGINAIDILMTVSKEMAGRFKNLSPAVTFSIKNHYPEIYQKHFEQRRDFIYNKIKINLTKGISQGMYRDDLSIELVARLYLSRLIDLHNPDFFPPERFSFETLFNVMFDSFVRSIAKPEGLAYYEDRKKKARL